MADMAFVELVPGEWVQTLYKRNKLKVYMKWNFLFS
jgi:hypothetical protein